VTWTPSSATCIAKGEQGRALQERLLDRGALSVAGQLLGLAQRMLDLSVDYVAQRKQFGKPIGSFQAVKHHLADVARYIEQAKPVLYRAAHALARGDVNAGVRVSQARLAANEASWIAARKGIQVHGAMGYTWEVDLQMFMKRTWALDASWGDRGFHKTRVSDYLFADATGLAPGHTFED
jgi:alkylation response protein AidB-like acyl-CoA dehydrogenase